MYEETMLYSKVAQKLPELDLLDGFGTKELKEFYNDKFLRAKHVLIGFVDAQGNTRTDAEALALATDIANRLKAGESIDDLMAEYSDDPGSESNPDGYIFIDSSKISDVTYSNLSMAGLVMTEEFTQGVAALEIGGISEPVQTEYGYHVIVRLDINETEDLFKNSVNDICMAMSYEFPEEYAAAYEAFEKSLNDKYALKKDHSVVDALMIEMYKTEHDPANQQMPMYY